MPSLSLASTITCSFVFNQTATTATYTLSLHDALPISRRRAPAASRGRQRRRACRAFCTRRGCARRLRRVQKARQADRWRSEEHTSELQSLRHLVCRLLLEKKKKKK